MANMITKAHVELGDQVEIISFGDERKNYTGEFNEPVSQYRADIKAISTPISFLLPLIFIKKIRAIRPDIIYVHLPNPLMHLLVSFFKIFLKGIKVYAIYHSDIINQKKLAPLYNYYFVHTSSVYDKLIVSSDNLWDHSKVLTQFPSTKKFVLNYCTDSTRRYIPREKFKGNILAIGRFVPYKGFPFLAQTIKSTDYQLTIIGDGPDYDLVKSLNASNIKLPGRVSEEEKNRLIEQSDLLIVSSINTSEAYGMIIVEAFESGLPVVANDIPSGVTYLAKDKERGLVVPVNDSKALIDGLKFLNDNPDQFAEYSRNARAFFEENLSFESFKNRLDQLRNNS